MTYPTLPICQVFVRSPQLSGRDARRSKGRKMAQAAHEAFIEIPGRKAVFDALDAFAASPTRRNLCITAARGAGLTSLLDMWVKQPAQMGHTIMIGLQPIPFPSIPMLAVICSLLWDKLTRLEHATEGAVTTISAPPPSFEHPKSWFTRNQILNLYHRDIVPMLWNSQITTIVIDNAQLIDKASFPWVLNLQNATHLSSRTTTNRRLIFGTQLGLNPSSKNAFVQMVYKHPRTKRSWIERLTLDVLSITDFFEMWVAAMEVNLQARFDDTITEDDQKLLLARYWQKTRGNWHGIADLLMVYHEELGPFRDKPSRVITRDVIERVHKRLKQVDWTFTDEANESGNHKGANGRKAS